MARIKVDLHDIFNNSRAIDQALQQAFDEAIEKKIREVGDHSRKGSGQLRKKVERFLQQPHIKSTISQDRKRQQEFLAGCSCFQILNTLCFDGDRYTFTARSVIVMPMADPCHSHTFAGELKLHP